jgi:aldehyde dehydrogenase (NAD+)
MLDPSDGEPFAAIAAGTAPDVDVAVGAARRAVEGRWGKLAPAEKGDLLAKLGRAIEEPFRRARADRGPRLRQAPAHSPEPTSPHVRATSSSTAVACDKLAGETLP